MRRRTRPFTIPGGIVRPGFVALTAAGALIASTFALMPPATAADSASPAEQAADWIEKELRATPTAILSKGGIPQYAASIDAAISLNAVGGHDAAVAEVLAAIEAAMPANKTSYIQPVEELTVEPFTQIGQAFYAGHLAQTAAFVSRPEQGLDPRSFGPDGAEVDLIDELMEGIAPPDVGGPQAEARGRIQDRFVDLNNADEVDFEDSLDTVTNIDQGWAVEALKRAAEAPGAGAALQTAASNTIDYLAKQQCDWNPFDDTGGYFQTRPPQSLGTDPQQCVTNVDKPDNLTTASVVLNLQSLGEPETGSQIETMLTGAIDYLLLEQKINGRFSQATLISPGVTVDEEAKATALAGLALAQAGETTAARHAASWLRGLQVFDPEPCTGMPLDARGAVAPTKKELADRKDAALGGLFPWRDSTAKALPLLLLAPRVSGPPLITGPTGFVHSGAKVSLRVTKMDDGERVCISGLKLTKFLLVKESALTVPLVAPAGTANRTYKVASMDGTRSVVMRVLDKKRLTVKAKKSVKRKKKQRVTVSGLAAGERVVVKLKGKTVAKGKANARGVFRKKFKVRAPLGSVNLKAWGQFKDRAGQTKFKVR